MCQCYVAEVVLNILRNPQKKKAKKRVKTFANFDSNGQWLIDLA